MHALALYVFIYLTWLELAQLQEILVSLPDIRLCMHHVFWREQLGRCLDHHFRRNWRDSGKYERRVSPKLSPLGLLQYHLDPIGDEVRA